MAKIRLECTDCGSRVKVRPTGDWTTTCKVCGGRRRADHDWTQPKETVSDTV